MTPAKYMMTGVAIGLVALAASIAFGSDAAVLAFGGGALFGKGYGIMEERER